MSLDTRPARQPTLPQNSRSALCASSPGWIAICSDHAARRDFLDRQIEGWQRRYARFIATEGDSEPILIPADPPQAADFLLTIVGLMARRCALEEQTRVHA